MIDYNYGVGGWSGAESKPRQFHTHRKKFLVRTLECNSNIRTGPITITNLSSTGIDNFDAPTITASKDNVSVAISGYACDCHALIGQGRLVEANQICGLEIPDFN